MQRFWEKVEKAEGGCWLWTGRIAGGYGLFVYRHPLSNKRCSSQAHRYAYQELRGEIPEGMHLHHSCRVRRCVNPEHLIPMTPSLHSRQHPRRFVGFGKRRRRYGEACCAVAEHLSALPRRPFNKRPTVAEFTQIPAARQVLYVVRDGVVEAHGFADVAALEVCFAPLSEEGFQRRTYDALHDGKVWVAYDCRWKPDDAEPLPAREQPAAAPRP